MEKHFAKIPQTETKHTLRFAPDMGEEILNMLYNVMLDNPQRFEPIQHGRADWQWGIVKGNDIYIIKRVLERILTEKNIDTKGFLEWARNNSYINAEPGRLTIVKRFPLINKVHRCVMFRLSDDNDKLTEARDQWIE